MTDVIVVLGAPFHPYVKEVSEMCLCVRAAGSPSCVQLDGGCCSVGLQPLPTFWTAYRVLMLTTAASFPQHNPSSPFLIARLCGSLSPAAETTPVCVEENLNEYI